MNDFEKVINFIASGKTETPTLYGWFHLTWLAITFAACAVIFAVRKKISRTQIDLTLVVWGGSLILLEVLKQLVVSFKNIDGEAVWHYAWWAFPFQFCSMPLYLALPAGFLRKGAIKDALYSFLASYAFMGGLAALIYPANMFTSSAFISIHTMLWHSSMVVILFMLLATGAVKPCKRSFLSATALFVILTSIAIILNVIIGECASAKGVNLFFISPYEAWKVPVIKFIYESVPYPVYLILYVAAMSAAAGLVFAVTHAVTRLDERFDKRREKSA